MRLVRKSAAKAEYILLISSSVKGCYFLSCPSQRLFLTSQSGSGPKSDDPEIHIFGTVLIVSTRSSCKNGEKLGQYSRWYTEQIETKQGAHRQGARERYSRLR